MHVEFLYWSGCPSHGKALVELRRIMVDLGVVPGTLTVRKVETPDEAALESFVGSPTIRVDGTDIAPGADAAPQLSCRVYRRRDGRVSPTPDPEDVRDALLVAQTTTAGRHG